MNGHELARAQIARHGRDRYPTQAAQYAKMLEEAGELGEAMLDMYNPGNPPDTAPARWDAVRREYADLGLAYHELGSKLGLDSVQEMRALVQADERKF